MNTIFEIYDILVTEKDLPKPKKKRVLSTKEQTQRDTQGNMFVPHPDPEDGNERITEGKKKQSLPKTLPVRNKQLNDLLQSKRGGRHFSEKTDYKRSVDKKLKDEDLE